MSAIIYYMLLCFSMLWIGLSVSLVFVSILLLIVCMDDIYMKLILYFFLTLHRTVEEEEGIRASEAIDRILSRLSKSDVVVKGKTIR